MLITHLDTNAPVLPCARTTPAVFPASCANNIVNVPFPLSYAPIPSPKPASLYEPIASPAVNNEVKDAPGVNGNKYGDCDEFEPVIPGTKTVLGALYATNLLAPFKL